MQNAQKFFASFFQKRSPSFWCPTSPDDTELRVGLVIGEIDHAACESDPIRCVRHGSGLARQPDTGFGRLGCSARAAGGLAGVGGCLAGGLPAVDEPGAEG